MSLFDETTQDAETTPAPMTAAEKKAADKAAKEAAKATESPKNTNTGANKAPAFLAHGVEGKYKPQSKAKYVEGEKPDKDLIKTDSDMRDYLFSFPKVQVFIPLTPGEKQGAREPVIVNGIRIDILKGAMASIPEPFAKVVFEHYNVQMESGSVGGQSLANSNSEKVNALR